MATDWNLMYRGRCVHSYLEVDVADRPQVFSGVPKHFWWLYHNPTQSNTGTSNFNFKNALPTSDLMYRILSPEAKREATRRVLEQVAKDAEPYMPYATGYLQSTAFVDPQASTLSYTAYYAPYAFDPETPFGTPKKYNKEVHSEAMGYPVEYTFVKNGNKYPEMFIEECLKLRYS